MFGKSAIGLDIADHTIEVVELEQPFFSNNPVIISQVRIPLEKGVVEHGRLLNRKQLASALSAVWENDSLKPVSRKNIIFGIPERQVYTSVVKLLVVKGTSIIDQITEVARATIPLEQDDLIFSYHIIAKSEQMYEILLYGTSREVIGEWDDFFTTSPYQVKAFDHELLAITRGLFGRQAHAPVCIVDCGAERTKIAVCSSRGLQYVHSLEIAGEYFTEQIAKSFEVSKDEADRIKREEGLEPLNRHALFEKLLEPIIAEILVACDYFEKGINEKIQEVILVGGSARLKGLVEYLQEKTSRTVRLGSSFLAFKQKNTTTDYLHFIEATGLALKGINPRLWEADHPSFKLSTVLND